MESKGTGDTVVPSHLSRGTGLTKVGGDGGSDALPASSPYIPWHPRSSSSPFHTGLGVPPPPPTTGGGLKRVGCPWEAGGPGVC